LLQDSEQRNTVILQLVLKLANEGVKSEQTGIDSLFFTFLQQLWDIIGHQATPTLWVVQLGDCLDAPDVLLHNQRLLTLIQFGNNLASELSLVGLFIQDNVFKVLRGNFLCVRLISILPMEVNKSAQLHGGSKRNLLIDLCIGRDIEQGNNVALLFLSLINELFGLFSEVGLRVHTCLEGLHQLLLHGTVNFASRKLFI
jgi:hypothetical protein